MRVNDTKPRTPTTGMLDQLPNVSCSDPEMPSRLRVNVRDLDAVQHNRPALCAVEAEQQAANLLVNRLQQIKVLRPLDHHDWITKHRPSLRGMTSRVRPSQEWVEFPIENRPGWKWRIDVTFLASDWQCIYGNGCQGIDGVPEHGCCSIGAVLSDASDQHRVLAHARLMTEDDPWEKRPKVVSHQSLFKPRWKDEGETVFNTRVKSKSCIFLNHDGCALHQAALRRNESPLAWKPEVCWMKPLSVIDDEVDQVITLHLDDGDWGGDEPNVWYCNNKPEAFSANNYVYITLEAELRSILGDNTYQAVFDYMSERIYGGRADRSGIQTEIAMEIPKLKSPQTTRS